MTPEPATIAIIGLGEVGETFAAALKKQAGIRLMTAGSGSARSAAAARRLGVTPVSAADAVAGADLVLICAVASSLEQIIGEIGNALKPDALVADLTSATRAQVQATYGGETAGRARCVDVAIMGAVSMQGSATPLIAAGAAAEELARLMTRHGFTIRALPGSRVGDASAVKLMRSVFAKGLEALMIESALAAEALGVRDEFLRQLDNSDSMPMREHLAMYLRTHPRHAARRGVEMEAAEEQLLSTGLPSLTTRAAIERYRRTIRLIEAGAGLPAGDDAASALEWLLKAERGSVASPALPPAG